MPLTGKCLCGAVTYRYEGEPIVTAHCHCEDCRRTSGTGHSTHVVIKEENFTLSGKLKGYGHPADNGTIVTRYFCPTCGAPIHSTNEVMPGIIMLRASSLDDLDSITPSMHVYTKRAAKWDQPDTALACFDTIPPEGPDMVLEGTEE